MSQDYGYIAPTGHDLSGGTPFWFWTLFWLAVLLVIFAFVGAVLEGIKEAEDAKGEKP